MKKLLFLCLLPVFALAQTSKNTAQGFTIKGTIKGLKDSTFIVVTNPMADNKAVATAYSKNGGFYLFGKVDQPDLYVINFVGYKEIKDFFLSNDAYTVTGDAKTMNAIKVNGGSLQKDYVAFGQKFDPVKNKLNALAATINNTPQGASRDSMINVFEKGKQQVVTMVGEFVKTKPSSPISAYVLLVTSPVNSDIATLQDRYNLLSKEVKEGFYGQQLNATIQQMNAQLVQSKVGMEGTQALDFTQNDTANNPVTLSSFRGKYVLVDFWASWCGPCRLENPNVVAAYNAFKDKNFTVLGVSLDRTREKWIEAIKADNLTWTHVSDLKFWSNEVAQLYQIQGIPANLLIDPSGKIIGKNLRGEQLLAVLQQVIK